MYHRGFSGHGDHHDYHGGGHPNLERGLIRRPKEQAKRRELPEHTKKYNKVMRAAEAQMNLDTKMAEAVSLPPSSLFPYAPPMVSPHPFILVELKKRRD